MTIGAMTTHKSTRELRDCAHCGLALANHGGTLVHLATLRAVGPALFGMPEHVATEIAPALVHNHGTEDGPGLACPERMVNGRLVGACMASEPALDLLDIAQWIEDDAADEDEQVREFAASIAARIRHLIN